jgi:hypothetical protein
VPADIQSGSVGSSDQELGGKEKMRKICLIAAVMICAIGVARAETLEEKAERTSYAIMAFIQSDVPQERKYGYRVLAYASKLADDANAYCDYILEQLGAYFNEPTAPSKMQKLESKKISGNQRILP